LQESIACENKDVEGRSPDGTLTLNEGLRNMCDKLCSDFLDDDIKDDVACFIQLSKTALHLKDFWGYDAGSCKEHEATVKTCLETVTTTTAPSPTTKKSSSSMISSSLMVMLVPVLTFMVENVLNA
jgi:hypothetical protein